MSTAKFEIGNLNSNRANYYKRQIKMRFATKKAEIIAWAIFFGVGVSYFVATILIAIL